MLGRRAKPGVGATEQRKIAFDQSRHTGAAISSPPKLFMALSSMSGEAASPELAEAIVSPTSTLQVAAAASPTSPATTCHGTAHVVPFSRHGSSGGVDRHRGKSRRSQSQSHRPWETARPVGLGLAGALNGETPGAATAVLMTGQSLRPVQLQNTSARCSPSPSPAAASKEFGVKSCRSHAFAGRSAAAQSSSPRRCLSPGEMEASEDYTRVVARGPNPRTTHIFDDRVFIDGGGFSSGSCGEDEFLRWCHGCSKDLGQGKDIFMYRGEMAFCSHECRYREMLFDGEL